MGTRRCRKSNELLSLEESGRKQLILMYFYVLVLQQGVFVEGSSGHHQMRQAAECQLLQITE